MAELSTIVILGPTKSFENILTKSLRKSKKLMNLTLLSKLASYETV